MIQRQLDTNTVDRSPADGTGLRLATPWSLRSRMLLAVVAVACLGMVCPGARAQQGSPSPEILRESIGDHLAALTKLELQPFESSLWTRLGDWTNSPALDASATNGKVVLIVTWASWNPASIRILSTLNQLQEKYADQGLLIVGVHHPQGWEDAAKIIKRKKVKFAVAHDLDGSFRKALLVDQDPDIYLIDRAGQLRYADIRTESLTNAVKQLLSEDADSAESVESRRLAKVTQHKKELLKPQMIKRLGRSAALPEVPFTPPAATLYQLVDWPVQKQDDNSRRNNNDSGPTAVGMPASGWISGVAPKNAGRAVVYYSWRLDNRASATVVERMDLLARQLGRDAVIVGVLTGVGTDDNSSRNNNTQIEPAELLRRAKRFRTTHGITHPMLIDPSGSIFQVSQSSRNEKNQSPAMVVSSDSVLRWSGRVADPGFRAALSRVIDIDPGIQARRAAEQAYIKAGGG